MFKRGFSVLVITIILALILETMPMPLTINHWRPDWLLMALVYWSLALPHRINVGSAWLCGFMLDVLLGSTLGIHALGLAVVVFVSSSNYQKIRNFSVWQQALIVCLLSLFYHLAVFWIERLLNGTQFQPAYLLSSVTTVFIWPWVFMILRKLRRQFKVT